MNILFVCTGNTCRSPMAAALLEEMARKEGMDIKVKSAGIFAQAGQKASKGAIHVLKMDGIDIEDTHKASMVSLDLLKEADLILTMGTSHKDALISRFKFVEGKTYTLKEYAYGIEEDIEDPFGGDIYIYNSTKDEIKDVLKDIIKKI
ncbi:MAG: low molecular weight protein arginine phosphatase [Tissierellia bacterium]|nr:low molecular weight protein arginine phosphatase [Tissierellia bacterium]